MTIKEIWKEKEKRDRVWVIKTAVKKAVPRINPLDKCID